MTTLSLRGLSRGDAAPLFTVASHATPRFTFDTAAGRVLVLTFFGSAGHPGGAGLLAAIETACGALFDDDRAAFFGVTQDAADRGRLAPRLPGMRYFFDEDGAVARLYGVLHSLDGKLTLEAMSVVIDAGLRIRAIVPPTPPETHATALRAEIMNAIVEAGTSDPVAPILVVPDVFEPALCRALVEFYEARGGQESGFMRSDSEGRTIGAFDRRHKRRRDQEIDDQALRTAIRARIERRLVPAIRKSFQFTATRIERYIVACYDAAEGGHFGPHRDNTTAGTAHRRFAVTLNLNPSEYEGGDLSFPEFGPRRYRAPEGGAVVFSCSLLHAAAPVTRGRRFACLPFLYDDAAAALREKNMGLIVTETARESVPS